MSIHKDKNGTWRVIYRYTDWTGERKQTSKRGFTTKREATAWEHAQSQKLTSNLNMSFASFYECYETDMKARLKENSWITKDAIVQTKIMPYFAKRQINEITTKDVIRWQNEMLNFRNENGEPYSPVYLKTLHNQLSALFNHAVKHYNLQENPASKVGNMGKSKNTENEKEIWTKEEYLTFIDAMMDKPISYYAFQMLYWCGIRIGELLALTPEDFDFEKGTVSITKSYQRLKSKDVITSPKTEKSIRTITMPQFLCDELSDYISSFYKIPPTERLFQISKSYLHNEMTRGAKVTGVKRIAIHSLRHSAVSLLIDMGFSPVAIADRVGHESIYITYNYAHLFPSKQMEIANNLNMEVENVKKN